MIRRESIRGISNMKKLREQRSKTMLTMIKDLNRTLEFRTKESHPRTERIFQTETKSRITTSIKKHLKNSLKNKVKIKRMVMVPPMPSTIDESSQLTHTSVPGLSLRQTSIWTLITLTLTSIRSKLISIRMSSPRTPSATLAGRITKTCTTGTMKILQILLQP